MRALFLTSRVKSVRQATANDNLAKYFQTNELLDKIAISAVTFLHYKFKFPAICHMRALILNSRVKSVRQATANGYLAKYFQTNKLLDKIAISAVTFLHHKLKSPAICHMF